MAVTALQSPSPLLDWNESSVLRKLRPSIMNASPSRRFAVSVSWSAGYALSTPGDGCLPPPGLPRITPGAATRHPRGWRAPTPGGRICYPRERKAATPGGAGIPPRRGSSARPARFCLMSFLVSFMLLSPCVVCRAAARSVGGFGCLLCGPRRGRGGMRTVRTASPPT